MKNSVRVVLGLSVAFFVLLAAAVSCEKSQARSQQAGDPATLVMTACTACHETQRICDGLGKKDKGAWNKTVTRMVDKGASVAPEDIPAVVEYLTDLKPGSQPVCK